MAEPTGRDPAIDAVRGLALLGILIANLPFFGLPGGVAGDWWREAFPGWHNVAAVFAIRTLFENTFILIFSFLFGYGAARQITTRSPAWFRWRLVGLALVGLLHGLLLWAGDVLLAYALIGLTLPFAVRCSQSGLLRAGLILYAVAVVGNAAVGALLVVLNPPLPDAGALLALYRGGDFLGLAQLRLMEWAEFYGFGTLVLFPLVAAAFLAGIAAERWLDGRAPSAPVPLAGRLAHFAFWPALLGNIAYGLFATAPHSVGGNAFIAPEIILRALCSPLLALLLFAWALRFFAAGDGPLLRAFAVNGRMSLSVYLGQSVVCVLLFHGYGLGLYGSIGPAASLLVSVAVFAVMTLLASLWLRAFRAGPAEMLIGAITAPFTAARPGWPGKPAYQDPKP